ncbi:Polyribonucleotide nucleotidyltransferase [subsurface metagenome]
MTEDLIMGKIYKAKVMEIRDFGAIVELIEGGQDGMVHISELADGFVGQVEDIIKMGEEIPLKVINFDDKRRARFSLKQAKADLGLPTQAPPSTDTGPRPPRRDGPPRGRGGPRRDGPPRRDRY